MAIITIDTQYYENYGFHEGTTHWKPKGGHKFTMEVSSDVATWTEDMKGKLSKIVEKEIEILSIINILLWYETNRFAFR